MEKIITSNGNYETDFCVSSPSSKTVYFRILGRPVDSVESIFRNVQNLQYMSTTYHGCAFLACFEEDNAVKVAMSYEGVFR